jgi:DNA-binding transcriptional LysR family regulator
VQSIDAMVAMHPMNLASIDLNLLVTLDALISEVHVGRASRKIGLSQPATSHALKRLRDLLKDPLLVRVGARMELTPRAISLRDSLPEALQRVKNLLVMDSFEPGKSSRRFSVMMPDHLGHLVVPALVKRIHSEAPGIGLDVLPWQSPASMRLERFRSIDLLISCSTRDLAGFERQALFTDTEVTVVRRGHPSTSRLSDLKVFLRSKHVAVVGRGLAEDPVDRWLRLEGVSRQIALCVPGYLQALQAVAQTDLVAFVPKRLADSLAKPWSLNVLAPPLDPGDYQEFLFYPRRATQDPGSLWLRKVALDAAQDIALGQRATSARVWKPPATRPSAA